MAPAAPPQEPSALPTTTAADAAAVPVPQSAVPQPAKASSGELDGRKAAGGAFTKKWTARLFGKAEPEAHPTETETAAAAEAAAAAAADSSAPRQLEVTFTVRGEEGGGEGGGGEGGGEEGLAGGVPRLFLGLHLSSTNAILAMEPGGLAAQVRLRAAA
jgi:hypothetical protein